MAVQERKAPKAPGKKTRSSFAARLAREGKLAAPLSKSSKRRQKQKSREQLAGNQQGMQALTDMVSEMEETMDAAAAKVDRPAGQTARSRRAMLYVPLLLTQGS